MRTITRWRCGTGWRRALATGFFVTVGAAQAAAFTVNKTPLTSTEKDIETLGTGIAIALPVVAGGITLLTHD